VPLSFWLFIALMVIVAFGVINNYYWRNVREEHHYRVRKWKERGTQQPS
jgi:hypothetical protein